MRTCLPSPPLSHAGTPLSPFFFQAYTLGGSVTKGQGARTPQAGYAERFFGFLNATWPHAQHVLLNKGIGGTSSGVFSACAEQLVDPQADLVVVEFTVNGAGGCGGAPVLWPWRLHWRARLASQTAAWSPPCILLAGPPSIPCLCLDAMQTRTTCLSPTRSGEDTSSCCASCSACRAPPRWCRCEGQGRVACLPLMRAQERTNHPTHPTPPCSCTATPGGAHWATA